VLHGDLLGERARLSPEKTALVYVPTGERFSYSQLDARARRCAKSWRGPLALQKGDRIGLLSHNRVEFLDAFFAAPKAGVILVPLGTRLTAHEIVPIVKDAELRMLCYDDDAIETVRSLKSLVAIERCVALGAKADPADLSYGELLAASGDAADFSNERCDPEDLYCLLYTSGTTGTPKGVMIPHRMVTWNGYNTVVSWQLREDDVSPIFTPLYHAGALGAFLVPIFTIGGTIVLHKGFETAEVWRTIENERCTVVLGVPTIWRMLMEAPEFATTDLKHVRAFYSGGAPLPHYIIEAYQRRGVVFKQGYGLTEVGVNCFAMSVEESVRKKGAIGRPLLFTEARLVDDEGHQVAVGEVGELLLRGPHVSKGYWRNPEATAAALDRDGFFHTGDLARRDEDGFFTIAGRKKDMIISGGVNVYPAEIEGELLLHQKVKDAAVVGVPDPQWGETGVAFVVAPEDGRPSADELAAFLRERLAKFKVPRAFVFLDALPRTPYGKVVKGELRERYLATARKAGA
jgi:fatty-acyl-CoA synthase